MHIAGRLALQSPACAVLPQRGVAIAPNPDILSFHGCDIVVRHITEHGFEAELATTLVEGAIVRLRLPGAGAMIARVKASHGGHLEVDIATFARDRVWARHWVWPAILAKLPKAVV